MDEADDGILCNDLFLAIPLMHDHLIKPFEALFRAGLSPMQFYTLVALHSKGCMGMTELANYFYIPKQQMTKIVNRLVLLGFVERLSDSSDRRLIKACLTGAGRAHLESYRKDVTNYLHSVLDRLAPEDKRELVRAIHSLHALLPKLSAQNPPGCSQPEEG